MCDSATARRIERKLDKLIAIAEQIAEDLQTEIIVDEDDGFMGILRTHKDEHKS